MGAPSQAPITPNAPEVPAAQAVHHEWRTAENSAAYLLPALAVLRDRNPKLALLDVGAGSGTITATLAKLVPEGRVLGVDKNEGILPRARANAAAAGATNVEFVVGDAYKLPFEDGAFDVVHCHQVLCHLKEPDVALREMMRVTRPGGIVAAREADYQTECIWPELPALVSFHELIVKTMTLAGGCPTAGRQLVAWALKAGVKREQITASYSNWCYVTPGDRRIWAQGLVAQLRAGRFRQLGLDAGLTTEIELKEMAEAWEEWKELEDASTAMMSAEIIIQT